MCRLVDMVTCECGQKMNHFECLINEKNNKD
jgi:hypothetical protein